MLEVSGLTVEYADQAAAARCARWTTCHSTWRRASSSPSSASPAAASRRCCSRSPSCCPRRRAITAGSVTFRGQNLVAMTGRQLNAIRWQNLSVVMQSAMNALNPVMSVGAQFADALRAHGMTLAEGDRRQVRRGAAAGRDRPGAPEELPAPAVRRDAAAGDDRDGAAVHPGPGDHGRAHLGARRGGAALADDADQGTAAGIRVRGHLRHPRHVAGQPLFRPADGDVRRAGRGIGPDQADIRQPAASVFTRAARGLSRHQGGQGPA